MTCSRRTSGRGFANLAVMSAIHSLLPLRADERELLRARVIVAGDRYAVVFTPGAQVVESDFVMFALHYYARVLFELVRTARSPRDLPTLIDRLCAAPLRPVGDLFSAAGVQGSFCRSIDERHTVEADCVLTAAAHRDFQLRGDFSRMTSRVLIGSVVAVIEAVVGRISPEMVELLRGALANMNASYGVTHRYSDAASLDEVPITAYRAASFV